MKRISNLEKKYILDVLNNQFRTSKNNKYNSILERKFAKKFRNTFAISHVNGTATLHTALNSLGIGKDDEVIVPPLTMSSTAISVLHAGATPIFADVEKDTFNICPISIKDSITKNTKAVMSVALYGLAPNYDEILKICKSYNLYLVEDNAECFLGYYKNKVVGSFGDFSSFSFQASKHMTCGEGGILLTKDEELADKARAFSSLGYANLSSKKGRISKEDIQSPNYDRHISLGFNYRLSEPGAAIALAQLERLERLVNQRMKCAKIFLKAIDSFSFINHQITPENCINSYWTLGLVLESNDNDKDWFNFRKIFIKNGGDEYYAAWKLTYEEPLFKNNEKIKNASWQKFEKGLCPTSEYLQKRLIQLKTNYWKISMAKKQSEILYKSLKEFNG